MFENRTNLAAPGGVTKKGPVCGRAFSQQRIIYFARVYSSWPVRSAAACLAMRETFCAWRLTA